MKKNKMTQIEKFFLQIGLFLMVLAGYYWITEIDVLEKKTSDRFGCSDFKTYIEQNFPDKPAVDCDKIQKRFKK